MSSEHKSLKQIMDHRLEKLSRIKDAGIDPFPHEFNKIHHIGDFCDNHNKLDENVTTAGRIVSFRKMGKASFLHLQDETGKIQVYMKSTELPENQYDGIGRNLDLGDFLGVSGKLFKTKTGEITVKASNIQILAKNIRPLPNLKEKDGIAFNAFEDKELRYRHRHLDMIANPELLHTFVERSKIITEIRKYMDNNGFLEVETPILQPIYGGANARPFTTFHNTLDQIFFLRIADELYLKRLIIGGFEKVYEIGKNFRNEGIDRNHNPEFTMMEFYQAYSDVYAASNFTEDLIKQIANSINKSELNFQDDVIDISMPFNRTTMAEELKKATGENVLEMEKSELFNLAKKHNLDVDEKMNYGGLLDELFSELVEKNLIQPTFVFDYPTSISPLAKVKRDSNAPLVERFELFIGGMEFANSFSELNDPIIQRERLESQAKLRELGDEEAQVVDENFLQAMEAGMPPTSGVGIGIDRLIMLFTGEKNIKDIILFPTLRSESK